MGKKLGLILILLVIGGIGLWMWRENFSRKETLVVMSEEFRANEMLVRVSDGKLWLGAGVRKVSMVNLKLSGVTAFKANKDVFNSEMLNKVDGDGKLNIVLGIMKSTADLPSGKILVGQINDGEEVPMVEGRVTVAGEGDIGPYEMEVTKW